MLGFGSGEAVDQRTDHVVLVTDHAWRSAQRGRPEAGATRLRGAGVDAPESNIDNPWHRLYALLAVVFVSPALMPLTAIAISSADA